MKTIIFLSTLLYSVIRGWELVTVTGPIVDLFCWENNDMKALDTGADLALNPFNHTIYCLFDVPQCRNSGYAFLHKPLGSDTWQIHYTLGPVGNMMAIKWMNYTNSTTRDEPTGYIFTYTGIDYGNGTLYEPDPALLAESPKLITVTGPIVDNYCWVNNSMRAADTDANLQLWPYKHTVFCLYEVPFCLASGYSFLHRTSGMSDEFSVLYSLDERGNEAAANAMSQVTWDTKIETGFSFTWTGWVEDGNMYLMSIDTTSTMMDSTSSTMMMDTTTMMDTTDVKDSVTRNFNSLFIFTFLVCLVFYL